MNNQNQYQKGITENAAKNENKNRNNNQIQENGQQNSNVSVQIPCKFEELNNEFLIQREIGRGSYGVVFKGIRNPKKDLVIGNLNDALNGDGDTAVSHNLYNHGEQYVYPLETTDRDENGNIKKYAIKRIFPTINASFILIEILILKYLNGQNNVTELLQAFRLEGQVSLIFRYQKSQPFATYLTDMSVQEVKHYMYCMLKAVEHLSNYGIMHRDIKPSNFLYDKNTKSGLLIDFGLSELELNNNQIPIKNQEDPVVKQIANLQKSLKIRNRTGTKGYMPPEALFNYHTQSTAVDIWACGVIFLSFCAGRHPVFSLNNSSKIKNFTISNLIPLTCLFGSNAIKEIAFKYGYGCLIPDEMQKDKIGWETLCAKIKDPLAFDLLDKMLELDHTKRIKACDVLKHQFFDEIRNERMEIDQSF